MSEPLTRAQFITQRWYRVLSMALLAFALMFVIGRAAHDKLDDIASVPTWGLLALGGAIAALATSMRKSHAIAGLRLRNVRTYPPYWFGVAIGTAAALFTMTHTSAKNDFKLHPDTIATLSYWSWFIAATPLACLTVAFATLPFRRKPVGTIPEVSTSARKLNASILMQWIASDAAVTLPEHDLFGHSSVAAKIAARLLRKEVPPQAVVGSVGSGKSTIGKLVNKYLVDAKPDPSVSFVSVELWPYATPRAAVEGVLRALTEAFSSEINTSQLKGLPEAYATAIAKLAGVSEWIPSILRSEPLAESDVLTAFDDIAVAIRRRFVLWVEDLERFGGGDPDSVPMPAELERLAPIRALLLGLGRLRAITVITVSTDLLRRFDIEKIAAYVEYVPQVALPDARRLIAELRKQWLTSANKIDPTQLSARRQLGWDEAQEQNPLMDWFALDNYVSDFAAAISVLASTPRTLKQGLRAAQDVWARLAGEIDLDDVIALSILRESHPNIFALIDKRLSYLRRENLHDRDKDHLAKLKQDILELKYDERTSLAVNTILTALFGPEARPRLQGVSKHYLHADYWDRFVGRQMPAEGRRDQEVLQILTSPDDTLIVESMIHETRSTIVESFARLLETSRMQGLLPKLANRLSGVAVSKWGDRHAPGIVSLWRMIRDRLGSIDLMQLEKDLETAIESVAPKNLALLQELVHLFTTSSRDLADIFPSETSRRVFTQSQKLLVQHYSKRPHQLVEQLRGAPAPLLLQTCYGLERIRQRQLGLPFPEWPSFAPTILEAVQHDAEVVGPQLSAFITKESPRINRPDEWLFDATQCEILFGDPHAIASQLKGAFGSKKADSRSDAVINLRSENREVPPDIEIEDDYETAIATTADKDVEDD